MSNLRKSGNKTTVGDLLEVKEYSDKAVTHLSKILYYSDHNSLERWKDHLDFLAYCVSSETSEDSDEKMESLGCLYHLRSFISTIQTELMMFEHDNSIKS